MILKERAEVYYYKTAYDGLEFIILSNANFSYPKHTHISSYTFGRVLKGDIVLYIQEKNFLCQSESTFIIYPDEIHSFKNLDGGYYDMMTISIQKSFLEKYPYKQAKDIVQDYIKMLVFLNYLDDNDDSYLEANLKLIYKHFYREKKADHSFLKIKNILETYPEENLSIQALSQIHKMSQYHFIRQFCKNIGMTPHRFQVQNRLRKAKNLLENSSFSLTTIGFDVGFFDQSHFIRSFKKLYQISPSAYKEALVELDTLAKSWKKFSK